MTAVNRYNPRLIHAPSYADIAREINVLGVRAQEAHLLATHLFYRPIKLEKVELPVAIRLQAMIQRNGGKAVVSMHSVRGDGLVDMVIVANASCLAAVVADLKQEPSPLGDMGREIGDVFSVLVEPQCGSHQVMVKGRVVDFSCRPYIMGILNVTPDSFSDGGTFFDHARAIEQAHRMVEEGADIIDIGGESTRPGSDPVSAEEELHRIIPVIEAIARDVEAVLSIDTTKAEVAARALAAGAGMINDVSALRFDPDLATVAAQSGVPVVLMHMRGTPKTMQHDVHYDDPLAEIVGYLRERMRFAEEAGIERGQIILDPGIGFGKSVDRDNFTILRNLEELTSLGRPLLVGPSRKAFLGRLLDLPVTDREEATAGAVAAAVMHGAHIIRVHNVKAMKQVAMVAHAIRAAAPLVKPVT